VSGFGGTAAGHTQKRPPSCGSATPGVPPDQSLDLHTDAFHAAGCGCLCTDRVRGARGHRPSLATALAACRSGDTLMVWKLDRLGRFLRPVPRH
jgi:hypothetical protein